MKRLSTFCLLLALFSSTLMGCESKPADDATPAAGDTTSTSDPNASDDPFAKMPEADRAAALAQKMCPVGDSPLGSMGTPIKVTVEGRDVYLCCEHCRETLEADPAKYFAILDAAAAGADEPASEPSDDEAADPAAEEANEPAAS
jgi:YHS domain-containing protein